MDDGHDVDEYLARTVPITAAMGVRFRSFDDAGVVMTAPLAPNINDKGIAFGGSIAAILSLAGWTLTDLLLRREGADADVILASSAIDYRLPVPGEIVAICPMPAPAEVERFLAQWRAKRRARWELEAFVESGRRPAALFRGVYVARPRSRAGSLTPPEGKSPGA